MKNIQKFLQDIKAELAEIEKANNSVADSIFDMETMFGLRPATVEEVKEHVDTNVSEDMRIALTQCDPFNIN